MNAKDVKQITVIGAGQMGHQIGMLCALGGYETIIQDLSEAALQDAEAKLQMIMSKWVAKGKLDEDAKAAAFGKLRFSSSLQESVLNSDLIIEAVTEKLDVKKRYSENWKSTRLLMPSLQPIAPQSLIV